MPAGPWPTADGARGARSTIDCHSDSLRDEITDVDISGQRNEFWDGEEVSPLRSKRNDLVIPTPYVPPAPLSAIKAKIRSRKASSDGTGMSLKTTRHSRSHAHKSES